MKPKAIGIVGGAGPLAGVLLAERIFALATLWFHCHRDADFPELLLLSFPFSEMLIEPVDATQVQREIGECLHRLRNQGAQILAIACNTVHAFLDPKDDQPDLVHLPRSVAASIPPGEIPLVLCTTTSARFGLHRRFFPCDYPKERDQKEIDQLIDLILQNVGAEKVLPRLQQFIESQPNSSIVLGCTELSLYSSRLQGNKRILDPIEIAAEKIVQLSFYKPKL
jgi:aspartate racemase